MKLADLDLVIAEEEPGGRLIFYPPDHPRTLPQLRNSLAAPVQPRRSEPIDVPFKVVSEPPKQPVHAGPVVHRLPAPKNYAHQPDAMAHLLMALSLYDEDDSLTASMLARQQAEAARAREQERAAAEALQRPPEPTRQELYDAGFKALMGLIDFARPMLVRSHEAEAAHRQEKYKRELDAFEADEAKRIAQAAAPFWKRPKSEPPKRPWFERMFGAGQRQSKKPVWR